MATRSDVSVLTDSHDCQGMQDVDGDKRLIVQTAAKLFQDFQQVQQKNNEYPDLFKNVQDYIDFQASSWTYESIFI